MQEKDSTQSLNIKNDMLREVIEKKAAESAVSDQIIEAMADYLMTMQFSTSRVRDLVRDRSLTYQQAIIAYFRELVEENKK